MKIEKIETERLLLIPFTKQLCHLVNDKNFVELKNKGLNAGEGYPDQETFDTIPKIVANIELSDGHTGFESWVIISKKEMKIIGDVGFKGIPNQAGEIDLGYGIIASERKKGYAFEAAKALCGWAISQENVNKITAKCLTENEGSYKTLEKLDFKRIASDNSMFYYTFDKMATS
jgi:ribosomal-protein-alanine N-acetyltransferase